MALSLFLEFNRVKSIVGVGFSGDAEKLNLLQQAISKSNILKLSKCKTKLKRRIPFSLKNVDTD